MSNAAFRHVTTDIVVPKNAASGDILAFQHQRKTDGSPCAARPPRTRAVGAPGTT